MFTVTNDLISYVLRQRLQGWIENAYAHDPVLGAVRSFCSDHSKVRVAADVAEDRPRIAVYDVPRSTCETVQVAPPNDLDGFLRWIDDVADMMYAASVRRFTSDLLHPSESDFVGLPGLLPSVVGQRIVGEIDERVVRGWRSVVRGVDAQFRPDEALWSLASACTVQGRWPDVMLVGRNILGELFEQSRGPRIVYVHPTRPMVIPFGRSVIVPGYESDPNAAYALHTSDFAIQRSPLQVLVEPASESGSAVRISVNRRHQLIATRRFRSGRFSRAAA